MKNILHNIFNRDPIEERIDISFKTKEDLQNAIQKINSIDDGDSSEFVNIENVKAVRKAYYINNEIYPSLDETNIKDMQISRPKAINEIVVNVDGKKEKKSFALFKDGNNYIYRYLNNPYVELYLKTSNFEPPFNVVCKIKIDLINSVDEMLRSYNDVVYILEYLFSGAQREQYKDIIIKRNYWERVKSLETHLGLTFDIKNKNDIINVDIAYLLLIEKKIILHQYDNFVQHIQQYSDEKYTLPQKNDLLMMKWSFIKKLDIYGKIIEIETNNYVPKVKIEDIVFINENELDLYCISPSEDEPIRLIECKSDIDLGYDLLEQAVPLVELRKNFWG